MSRWMMSAIVSLALVNVLAAQDPKPADAKEAAKAPEWKLGVQAYSFNRFTFFEAVDKAKALKLKYIEAYPGQALSPEQKGVKFDQNMSAEVQAQVKKKLKDAGVTLVNYGVVGLGDNEESARKVFEFAKAMGIKTIVSEPNPATMEMLDKLTEEFKIGVAIHNHPKPSPYWDPEFVLKAVKGRGKRIGACADTGHWVRSGLDPVECLKKLEGRIISLHFKDLNEKAGNAHDVPWGTGVANVETMLAELKRQGFSGVFSIEYEHNWDNSMPDIAKCIEAFNKFAKGLEVKLAAK